MHTNALTQQYPEVRLSHCPCTHEVACQLRLSALFFLLASGVSILDLFFFFASEYTKMGFAYYCNFKIPHHIINMQHY